MPRGGRRPGSGARKGNTNAMTSMNYSPRAHVLLQLFIACPDKRPIYELLFANGITFQRKPTPAELRLAIAIFDQFFFDGSSAKQSRTIKHNQISAPETALPLATPEDPQA